MADYRQDVSNEMYGFQMGSEWTLLTKNRFAAGGHFKAGVFQNYSEHRASVRNAAGAVGLPIDEDKKNAAFMGELRLSFDFYLNEMLMLRTGYTFIWLANVTLASDQPTVSDFRVGAGTDFEGNTLMHGMSVGLEAWW